MSGIQYVPYFPRFAPPHIQQQGAKTDDVAVVPPQGYAQPLIFGLQSLQPIDTGSQLAPAASIGSRPYPIIIDDAPIEPTPIVVDDAGSLNESKDRTKLPPVAEPTAVDRVHGTNSPFTNLAPPPEPTTTVEPRHSLRVRSVSSRLPLRHDTKQDTDPVPTKGPPQPSPSFSAPSSASSTDRKRKLSSEEPLGRTTLASGSGSGSTPARISASSPAPTLASTSSSTSKSSEIKMSQIRELIAPAKLRENKPVPLFKLLRTRVVNDVVQKPMFEPTPSELREILSALKNSAPPEYLRKMADDEKYMFVLKKWLLKCVKEPREWEKVTAPLLGMLARTDMPVDFLIEYKFGRAAKQAYEKSQELGLASKREIQVAYKAYEEWVRLNLLPKNRLSAIAQEDDAAKKRKLDDGSSKVQSSTLTKPSAVFSASSSATAKSPLRKDPISSSSKVSTDMSFFGAPSATATAQPKPRTKLPDIKKRDSGSVPPPAASSTTQNLLQKTMRSLQNPPPTVAQHKPSVNETPLPPPIEKKIDVKKPNRKGFVVRFVDLVEHGRPLVAVKLFKQEPHELERPPWATDTDGSTAHELDMAEGRALRQHEQMEEDIVWYEPEEFLGALPLLDPTPEAIQQDLREAGTLAINYPPGGVPFEPDESSVLIVERTPQTGAWYPHAGAPLPLPSLAAPAPPVGDVSALLGSLKPAFLFGQQQHQAPLPPPPPPYVMPVGQPQGYGYGVYPRPSHPLPQQQQVQDVGWRPPAQQGGYVYGGNEWQGQSSVSGYGRGPASK